MTDLIVSAKPAVEELLGADEDTLYSQLAIRVKAMRKDPVVGASFLATDVTYDAGEMGLMDDLRDFGRRFSDKLITDVFELMCGTDDAHDLADDRKKLQETFKIGKTEIAAGIAALMVAHLGTAPAIASVIAVLVVKLFFKNAYESMCETWKERLIVPLDTV